MWLILYPIYWVIKRLIIDAILLCLVIALVVSGLIHYAPVWTRHFTESTSEEELNREIQTKADRDEVLARIKDRATSGEFLHGPITVRRVFDIHATHPPGTLLYELPGTEGAANGNSGGTPNGTNSSQMSMGRLVTTLQNYTTKEEVRSLRYGALKGDVLFIYMDETMKEVTAAVDMSQFTVRIVKKDGIFKGKDGEMFGKKTQIALIPVLEGKHGLPILVKGMTASDARSSTGRQIEEQPIYLTIKSSIIKAEWYTALMAVSAEHPTFDTMISPSGLRAAVSTIEKEPDPSGSRAVAALATILFFALHKTKFLEQLILERINKKIAKVSSDIPDFITDLKVEEFNVGGTAPILSNIQLKRYDPDGSTVVAAHVSVQPGPGVADSAKVKASAKITLSQMTRIPAIDVMIIGHLRSIEGDIEIHFKPAPSNRFWWCFTKPPKMDYSIQPVISKKMVFDYTFIATQMDKFIKRAMADTCIFPNMDDIAFFNTSEYDTRGGIYSHMGRNYTAPEETEHEPEHAPVNMTTSAEDPTSATVDSTLHRRVPAKSQTTDVPARDHDEEIHQGIPRTDTSPAGLSSQVKTSLRKSGLGGAWTPSIAESRTTSTDSLSRTTKAESIAPGISVNSTPAVSRTASDTATPSIIPPSSREISPSQLTALHSELQTLRPSSPAPFIHPTDLSQVSPISTNSDAASTSTTTSSMFNSFKAGDTKALQGQFTATRDKMLSGAKEKMNSKMSAWSWRSKERTASHESVPEFKEPAKPHTIVNTAPGGSKEAAKPKPQTSTPASPVMVEPTPRRSLDQKPMTLQERLAVAAAASGAGAATSTNLARARSNTASSKGSSSGGAKPALLSHPSKSGAPPVESSASASAATPSEIPAETSTAKSAKSASTSSSGSGSAASSGKESRRESSGSLTTMQPVAGKGMAIPRASKPAEETAAGDTLQSDADDNVSPPVLDVPPSRTLQPAPEVQAPPLPPRKSLEEERPTATIPPPLPSRPATLSPPKETSAAPPESSDPPVPNGADLVRSDSAPPATTSPPSDEIHSPPKPSPPALPLRPVDYNGAVNEPEQAEIQETPEKEQKGDLASAIEADASAPPVAPEGIIVEVSPTKSTPKTSPTKNSLSPYGTGSPLGSSPGSSAEEALRKLASRDTAARASQEPSSPSPAAEPDDSSSPGQ